MRKLKYVKLFEKFNIENYQTSSYIKLFCALTLEIITGKYNNFSDAKNSLGNKCITPKQLADELYMNVLRKRKEINDDFHKIPNDLKQLWTDKFKSDKLYKWGSWVGYQKFDFEGSQEKTNNIYISIDVDNLDNIRNFVNNINKLHNDLRSLSKSKKRSILWKTHNDIESFINDHDNLKVYFNDNSLESEINQIIDNWCKKYNIKTEKRQHNKGFDYTKDDLNLSFGQILSHLIVLKIFSNTKRMYEKYYKGKELTIEDVSEIVNSFEKNLNREDGQGIIDKIIKSYQEDKIDNEKVYDYIRNIKNIPDIILNSNVFK